MSDDAITAVRLQVSGRVQGVGFRWFVMKRAAELQVTGWVQNLPGGRVEVVAKGKRANIDALVSVVTSGPRLARVDNVEKSDIPLDTVSHNSFEVK